MFGTTADKLDYGFIWYLLTPICLLIIWCSLRTVHAAALAQFRGFNDYIDQNDREHGCTKAGIEWGVQMGEMKRFWAVGPKSMKRY